MKLHRFFTLALSVLLFMPATAQDRNNEDEVVKLDARFSAHNYRQGEVIVKFKNQSTAVIKAPRRTKFKTTGVGGLDATLRELGVTEVEELMPLTGSQQIKRFARAVNGKAVAAPAMNRIYLMHYDKAKARNAEEVAAKLSKLADVEYAEPNRIVYALGSVADRALPSMALTDNQNGGVRAA